MRLSGDEIEYLAKKIVKTLAAERKIEVEDEASLHAGLVRVITDELSVEDRLNEEVRQVLIEHSRDIERANITYSEMFKMVKRKLAKEKGIVL